MTDANASTRRIADREVSALGIGGVQWSLVDNPDIPAAVDAIRAAVDAGVTLIDTAYAYTTPEDECHNERVVAAALAGHPDRDRVLVATKGGHWRTPDGWRISNRPEVLRKHLTGSLRALHVDRIGLYQIHHPDPEVPVEETMAAMVEFQAEGLIEHIGVSNFDVALLERARAVAPIAAIQNCYSPLRLADEDVVRHAEENDIAYLAHTPFGGRGRIDQFTQALPATAARAVQLGVSLHAFVLAWLIQRSATLVPIPGVGTVQTARDVARALTLTLSPEDVATLDAEAVTGDWKS